MDLPCVADPYTSIQWVKQLCLKTWGSTSKVLMFTHFLRSSGTAQNLLGHHALHKQGHRNENKASVWLIIY